jgi:hypothetical protein
MLRRASIIAFVQAMFMVPMAAQDDNQVKVEFHGFVNSEVMHDSRQVQKGREGEVLLFPLDKKLDATGKDENAYGELSMFNFHTRLQAAVTGPQIGKFKSSALIEGDFLGSTDAAPNMLRLRHAYFKLTSNKTEFLIGQYWHPMFVAECFPDIVGWNVGLPVHVLSRNPQIRFSYMPSENFKITVAALSQRDFVSAGPASATDNTSTNSSVYIKRSNIPDMQLQMIVKTAPTHTMGITGGYKVIAPRTLAVATLENSKKVENNNLETIGSFNLNAFSSLKTDKFSWLVEAIYGQNMSNFMMLGGYAVKTVDANDKRTYEATNVRSIWTDFAYNVTPKIKLGVYTGYTENLGSKHEVYDNDTNDATFTPIYFGLGNNIDHLYIIAPRAVYTVKRVKFAVEWFRETAAYGTLNSKMEVTKTHDVTNDRILASATYSF